MKNGGRGGEKLTNQTILALDRSHKILIKELMSDNFDSSVAERIKTSPKSKFNSDAKDMTINIESNITLYKFLTPQQKRKSTSIHQSSSTMNHHSTSAVEIQLNSATSNMTRVPAPLVRSFSLNSLPPQKQVVETNSCVTPTPELNLPSLPTEDEIDEDEDPLELLGTVNLHLQLLGLFQKHLLME
jgi:hypothetical protein